MKIIAIPYEDGRDDGSDRIMSDTEYRLGVLPADFEHLVAKGFVRIPKLPPGHVALAAGTAEDGVRLIDIALELSLEKARTNRRNQRDPSQTGDLCPHGYNTTTCSVCR